MRTTADKISGDAPPDRFTIMSDEGCCRTASNHPMTCGKVEPFQQTLKKWLAAKPTLPATIDDLQALLDVH